MPYPGHHHLRHLLDLIDIAVNPRHANFILRVRRVESAAQCITRIESCKLSVLHKMTILSGLRSPGQLSLRYWPPTGPSPWYRWGTKTAQARVASKSYLLLCVGNVKVLVPANAWQTCCLDLSHLYN